MYTCPFGTFAYSVKSGDTLYDIARRYNTTIEAIMSFNPFIDPERITVNQIICVPYTSQMPLPIDAKCNYVVIKHGDTLKDLASTYNTSVEAIINANPGIIPNLLQVGQVVCIPVVNLTDDTRKQPSITRCVNIKVRQDDTPMILAKRYKTTVEEIMKANPNIDPRDLKIGQSICIPVNAENLELLTPKPTLTPNCIYYIVKQGDTFKDLAPKYNVTIDSLLNANPNVDPNNLKIGQSICIPTSRMQNSEVRIKKEVMPQEPMVGCIKIKIKQGDYPYLLAQKYKTTVDEILKYNPHLNPNNMDIGQTICIPVIEQNFDLLSNETKPSMSYNCIYYTIKAGDTFKDLAPKYNLSVDQLLTANPGIDPTNLKIGQVICIPQKEVMPKAMSVMKGNSNDVSYLDDEIRMNPMTNCIYYTIVKGDMIKDLAVKFNTTTEAIISANSSIEPNNLQIGQVICIPNTFTNVSCTNYVIKKGDTFKDLAKMYNITVEAIMVANPNVDPSKLQVGQVICLPKPSSVTNCVYRTIRRGDTFKDLAKMYNTKVEAIINANPTVNPNDLQIGQVICIPRLMMINETRREDNCVKYKIVSGDTFAKLARTYNMTINDLLVANPGVDPNNLTIGQEICIPIVNEMQKTSLANLTKKLRVLWGYHSILDHLLILHILNDLPATNEIKDRLNENPNEFKELLIQYYGEENALRFAKLLSNHITLGEELIKALKDNDTVKAKQIEDDLNRNASELGRLVKSLNPTYDFDRWDKLFTNHVKLVKDIITNYLNGDYANAINAFEQDYMNSLEIADKMGAGIIKQYPKQS